METVEISLTGDRDDNQDRGAIAKSSEASLLVVVDGMGGHALGELAAQTAVDTIVREFEQEPFPIDDGREFLGRCIAKAQAAVVDLGESVQSEDRPRATPATCPRQTALRLDLPCVEVAGVEALRDGVESVLRLSRARNGPVVLVAHHQVLRSRGTIPLRAHRAGRAGGAAMDPGGRANTVWYRSTSIDSGDRRM